MKKNIWVVDFSKKAKKQLQSLDPPIQKKIIEYLEKSAEGDPNRFGYNLTEDKVGLWRYRVGDYRILCEIHDHVLEIWVVRVGHRKDVYD